MALNRVVGRPNPSSGTGCRSPSATLGEDPLAPQRDGAGHEQWSYTSSRRSSRGDRVLRYLTKADDGAAIVGWYGGDDGAVGRDDHTWQARAR